MARWCHTARAAAGVLLSLGDDANDHNLLQRGLPFRMRLHHLSLVGEPVGGIFELLQLRVLRLGFLQDGDVGVGIFPEGEEVLIRGAGFGVVSL
jgi:hypothetical protein